MSDILDVANTLDDIAGNDDSKPSEDSSPASEELAYPSEVVTPSGEVVKLDQRAIHNSIMLGQMSRREILANLHANQQRQK